MMPVLLLVLLTGQVTSEAVKCGGGACAVGASPNYLLQQSALYGNKASRVDLSESDEDQGFLSADQAKSATVARSNKEAIRDLHRKTEDHLVTLTGLLAGQKALPDSLNTLIEAVIEHSGDIKTKLQSEHSLQSADLDTKFGAISACDTTLTTDEGALEDITSATSAKSLASSAKAALCTCRKQQAMDTADWLGCNQELVCYGEVRDLKETAKDDFAWDPSKSQTKDMYKTQADVDMCVDTNEWANTAGATDDDKILQWFTDQKQVWDNHWDGKKQTFQSLIQAYDAAKDQYLDLKEGRSGSEYEGRGCDGLETTKDGKIADCRTLQTRATMNQCYYRGQKQNICDTYTQCRDDAELAWTNAQTLETADSQDRKDAWVAATQIECLVNQFSQDENGTLQFGSSSVDCNALSCDSACTTALDLAISLGRTFLARSTCALPAQPCSNGGWSPTCSSTETSSWGDHTPAYAIGTRTQPNCAGTPTEVSLATHEAAEPCEPCSDLPDWDEDDFDPFSSAPTPAPPTVTPTVAPTVTPTVTPTEGPITDGTTFVWAGLQWESHGTNNKVHPDGSLEVEGWYSDPKSRVQTVLDDFELPLVVQLDMRIKAGTENECLGLQVFPSDSCRRHDCGYVAGIGWWANKFGIVTPSGNQQYGEVPNLNDWHTVKMVLPESGENEYYLDGTLKGTIQDNQKSSGMLRFMQCATGQYRGLIVTQATTTTTTTTTAGASTTFVAASIDGTHFTSYYGAGKAWDGDTTTFYQNCCGQFGTDCQPPLYPGQCHDTGGWTQATFTCAGPITQIRFYPRPGYEDRPIGAKFTCISTDGSEVDLHTIASSIAGWNVVPVTDSPACQSLKYSGGGKRQPITEIEVDGICN